MGKTVRRYISVFIGLVWAMQVKAQEIVQEVVLPKTQYVEFFNVKHLHPLFDSLLSLQNDSAKRLNILHIGDSHIQGNYMTDKIRNMFYADFGLAGKGLTFPFRLAKTNSPKEVQSFSYQKWVSWKNTQVSFTAKVGILGISLLNYYSKASLNIKIPAGYENYHFDRVSIIYTPLTKGTTVLVKDSNRIALKKSMSNYELGFVVDHFSSKNPLNQLLLQFSNKGKYAKCLLHGICLENTKKGGIRYHVAGVNGSHYRSWSGSTILPKQSSYLKPNLIIISLGTNDANDFLLTTHDFTNYMDKLISSLQKCNPKAKFILTTPPDSYFRRTVPNYRVDAIRLAIMHYAQEKNLCVWDLYQVMGGSGSIKNWYDLGLASQDLIHFSKTGYEYQGELFYQTFIKHYHDYAANRLK